MNKFQRVGVFFEVLVTLSWQMEKKKKKAVPIKNKLGAFQPQTNSETEKRKDVNKQTPLKISISL